MKRAFTLLELIVVLAILVILAAILLPVFSRTRCGPNARSSCQSNLRQIALAWKQYSADFDHAPTLSINGNFYGWSDALMQYNAKAALFQCPSRGVLAGTDPTTPDFSDYWMNRRVAGRAPAALDFPARTLILGEGEGGDARCALSHLPIEWRNSPTSPAHRHGEGANYAFADGHAKWLKPAQVTMKKSGADPTFLIR